VGLVRRKFIECNEKLHEPTYITLVHTNLKNFRSLVSDQATQFWEAAEHLQRETNYPYEMMPLLFALIKSTGGNSHEANKLIQEGRIKWNEVDPKPSSPNSCGNEYDLCDISITNIQKKDHPPEHSESKSQSSASVEKKLTPKPASETPNSHSIEKILDCTKRFQQPLYFSFPHSTCQLENSINDKVKVKIASNGLENSYMKTHSLALDLSKSCMKEDAFAKNCERLAQTFVDNEYKLILEQNPGYEKEISNYLSNLFKMKSGPR
jgi:hypothetical protein